MRVFEAEAIRARLPRRRASSTRTPPSRACACTRTPAEIAALRRAIAISEAALAATLADAAAGMSETEFRQRLVAEMLDAGADGLVVRPDRAGRRRLRRPARQPRAPTAGSTRGQPLLIDFGAAWGGYVADITRTFFVGSASPSTATSTRRCAPPTPSAARSPRRA